MSAVCFALIATGPVQFATIYRPTCRQSAAVVHAFDCMQRIPHSSPNTISKKPTNYLHRDHDVGMEASFCGLGQSISATCQTSLFGSFPVSVFRRVADVLNAQAPQLPLAIGRSGGRELVGTFASVWSDSALEHAGHAALCPSQTVVRIRTRRAGSAMCLAASSSVLDRAVSQAVCYRRLCFLFALPRIGGLWFWPQIPRLGGPVFGLFTGGSLP